MNRRVYLPAITHLARDASAFDFRPTDGAPLEPFTAGAHVDLILPNGVRRSYSLCNAQEETHRYVVGVRPRRAAARRSICTTNCASATRSRSRRRAIIFRSTRAPPTPC